MYSENINMKTSKELWDALEIEFVGLKKFIVAMFLKFKMVDRKLLSPGSETASDYSRSSC